MSAPAGKPPARRAMRAADGKPRGGFTLVEMLAVLAVIVILIALIGPPITSIVRGPLMTQAADETVALLNLGQQTAVARNQSVAVRFYQYADTAAGESASSAATWKYRAMQLFIVSDDGAVTPLQAVVALPAGIIADSGATLSTLLIKTQQKSWTSGNSADPQVPLPRAGTSYNCCEFRFRPDGSTNLPPMPPSTSDPATQANPSSGWFITLHNNSDGDARTAPPANYVTVQIDPTNGECVVYRP